MMIIQLKVIGPEHSTYNKVGVEMLNNNVVLLHFFAQSTRKCSEERFGARIGGQHGRRNGSRKRTRVQN